MFRRTLLGSAAAVAALSSAAPALAEAHIDELTVGYFLEWPMPFQFAKVQGTYEEALGLPINWVSFDTGTAMSAAMASGDVDISVSQGVPPFVVATSGGQDLVILDVAVSYSENDNCVVRSDLEIDGENVADLSGQRVSVPLGTAAHYGFLSQMNHFGVDVASLEVVDLAPAEGANALEQGDVAMACGWGGALRRMKEHGNVLLTGAEKEELGILVFDVTSAPAQFVDENPDVVSAFLQVTADANAMWNSGENNAEMIPVIAQDAGMDEQAVEETMATFVFPSVEDQLSERWLGGNAASFMLGVAGVFEEAGSIEGALESYEDSIDTSGLEAVQGDM